MDLCEWMTRLRASEPLQYCHPGAMGVSGLVLVGVLSAASFTDLRHRLIRNKTTYPAIVLGLLLNTAVSLIGTPEGLPGNCSIAILGGIGIWSSVWGGILCFGGMCVQFLVFGTGAGDVKLMAALGVLLGWYTGLEVWICTMLLAALFAVVLLLVRVGYKSTLALLFQNLGTLGTPVVAAVGASGEAAKQELRKRMPLAPFFAVSCVVVVAVPIMSSGETFLEWALRIL